MMWFDKCKDSEAYWLNELKPGTMLVHKTHVKDKKNCLVMIIKTWWTKVEPIDDIGLVGEYVTMMVLDSSNTTVKEYTAKCDEFYMYWLHVRTT